MNVVWRRIQEARFKTRFNGMQNFS
jgi:hypothetical protein